jgi:hypothetical protein
MKSVGSDGNWFLSFMMKEMVWYFVSDTHKVMIPHILFVFGLVHWNYFCGLPFVISSYTNISWLNSHSSTLLGIMGGVFKSFGVGKGMMPPGNCMNQCLELIYDYITSLGLKICTMLRCSFFRWWHPLMVGYWCAVHIESSNKNPLLGIHFYLDDDIVSEAEAVLTTSDWIMMSTMSWVSLLGGKDCDPEWKERSGVDWQLPMVSFGYFLSSRSVLNLLNASF